MSEAEALKLRYQGIIENTKINVTLFSAILIANTMILYLDHDLTRKLASTIILLGYAMLAFYSILTAAKELDRIESKIAEER